LGASHSGTDAADLRVEHREYLAQFAKFAASGRHDCYLMDFFHTHISPKAVELAAETLRSTFVSEGKRVREFEEELTRVLGIRRAVAVNSGTSALHLALVLSEVGPGDEVVLPPQTFVASGLAILMCGAKPTFADIEPVTGNMDPISLSEKINPRTKAIMPVHWGGYPCDMDAINAIALEHGLTVIEDAAHALGAIYKGRPVGTLSRFTAFSFQAIKHLTTGDGGALCCTQEDDYEAARRKRWFGIDREHDEQSVLGERVYDLKGIGFKYHLNDLAAAVGLGNLPDVPDILTRHRKIARLYCQELSDVPGLKLLEYRADRESSWWFFCILVEQRENFIRALKSRGIPSTVVHQRIDRNRVFGGERQELVGQRFFNERQVALPIHCNLLDEELECVVASVKQGW
jgi:dTDP-4-amino-4,6-dideoxygalactose transaminase